jgi:hypothetical protein
VLLVVAVEQRQRVTVLDRHYPAGERLRAGGPRERRG